MVSYITYKEKKLPIRVSYYALLKFKETTGSEFSEKDFGMESIGPILFYSIESGCKATGEKFEFVYEKDLFELLEECFFEFAEKIYDFFPEKEGVPVMGLGNRQQRRETQSKPATKKKRKKLS